ncbi:Ni/Fe hydrogenase subunit alpha [Magnetofaba australis]|uniref:Putative nickel-dependent hydrogenase, large subunit n=1 Tax=Magnetofaba australis IT-1 TaxID=1434232 RepID=A0A1Y2K5E8_9PROT|nr:Ni/Fe hydrogenase subunit alpha [Magnetofaba australis]OSM04234.1 putative nickel-dependent hydrogenase, large subunit [Magnetofaba australis IT-1]
MTRTIEINHVYRVEGHGGIRVVMDDRGVQRCEMDIFEGARFYEALLRGKSAREVPGIICRVCAICAAGHTLCSVGAIENALSITPSADALRFRELLNLGQFIESHALHLFCLAAPDYEGFASVLGMLEKFPDEVGKGLALKRVGNRIQEIVGGRAIHPMNVVVGGLGKRPSAEQMRPLADELDGALEQALSLESLVVGWKTPELGLEEPLYVALRPDGDAFALTGSTIAARGYEELPVAQFRARVHESVVRHSTAKQSRFANRPFMVGAAARLFHNGERLTGEAGRLFAQWMPRPILTSHNTLAQYVELVWAIERACVLARELIEGPPIVNAPIEREPTTHQGVAALEVPRGTLYHAYLCNAEGLIADADVITPTAQNLANIEQDFHHLAAYGLQRGVEEAEMRGRLEFMARAYDPCISCATHLVDLTWRRSA